MVAEEAEHLGASSPQEIPYILVLGLPISVGLARAECIHTSDFNLQMYFFPALLT